MRSKLAAAILLVNMDLDAATLITIPIEQPARPGVLFPPHNLAINFQTGDTPVIVSSVDIAFDTIPANFSVWLAGQAIFDPYYPPGNIVAAEIFLPSQIFPGGLSITFPDTFVPAASFYAVLLTFFIFSEPQGSYFQGSRADTQAVASTFHSAVFSDPLGNPNTLAGSPALAVHGLIIPEPDSATCFVLGLGLAFAHRRRSPSSSSPRDD